MKFRINIYLKIKIFIIAFFLNKKKLQEKISKNVKKNSKKKYFGLTSQLRTAFLVLLKYLIKKYPKKNEIVFIDYNLPEMINVARNLKLKIKFNNINQNNWFFNFTDLKKQVNNKTLAVVLTNMFNNSNDTLKIKKFCNEKKIILIEDNAIYFDNFTLKNKKKIFTGSFGSYSLYSFNIMKNISALYGGGISHNDKQFNFFFKNYQSSLNNFSNIILIKQAIVFLLLKVFSNNFIYRIFFFHIVKISHLKNIKLIIKMFYPGLKFKKVKFPINYFSKISTLSTRLVYLQLNDYIQRKYNHKIRLKNNMLYSKIFKSLKIKNVIYPNISDKNFQNFIDFPIMIKDKQKFIKYALNNNFEVRSYYYNDCEKIFSTKKKANNFENRIICLPNHYKIDEKYIVKIINCIKSFYNS